MLASPAKRPGNDQDGPGSASVRHVAASGDSDQEAKPEKEGKKRTGKGRPDRCWHLFLQHALFAIPGKGSAEAKRAGKRWVEEISTEPPQSPDCSKAQAERNSRDRCSGVEAHSDLLLSFSIMFV